MYCYEEKQNNFRNQNSCFLLKSHLVMVFRGINPHLSNAISQQPLSYCQKVYSLNLSETKTLGGCIRGIFQFMHPRGLIDKISSIKFVFGLMSKQNQLQPNQMWFPHWNTYKRFMLVAFWQISKFCLQSPFWCPNFNKKLSNFDFQTPWIHFGPPRTHSIYQPVLNDQNSLKWEKNGFWGAT